MARWLKQSTAFTFRIGPFVDATDGDTAETGLTISQADIQISKNGGAFAQTSASPTTTHDADGWYQCPLTATDTNTLGPLTVKITESGALKVWEHFMVVPAAVYDTLVAGIIPMQGNSTYGTMQSGSTSSNAVLASATSFVDDLVIGSTLVITGGTGAGQSRVIHDWVSSTDTASISPNWTTTPDNTSTYVVVPTPPAPTNSAALPAVNATQVGGQTASASGTVTFPNATLASTTNITGGTITTATNVTTVNGLAANVLTAAATAADFGTEVGTAVWATAARTLTALDEDSTTMDLDATIRAALGMASANLDTQISSVQSDTNDIQTRIPAALVSGRMDSSTGAMAANVITAAATAADFGAEVADAVWDEALAGHAGAGSAGEALSAAGTAGDPWTTALPGAYSAGQAGYIIGQNINATISSRASQTSLDTLDDLVDTEVAAIKAKTDQMTFGVANQLNVNTKSMNDTTVNGTGTSGDKWRGA